MIESPQKPRFGTRRHRVTWRSVRYLSATIGLLLVVAAQAEALQLDLGEGLAYFRAHELPADLPPAAVKPGAMVLDLRFTTAAEPSAGALSAWLKFRVSANTPVFVLVNAETSRTLSEVLVACKTTAGFLLIGPAASHLTPDITITITPEAERRAYDALEHGASLESLITQNAGKTRSDEAAIMHARANPPAEVGDSELSDFDTPENKVELPATPEPAPAIDVSLQRAIQLHRGLLALKRLGH